MATISPDAFSVTLTNTDLSPNNFGNNHITFTAAGLSVPSFMSGFENLPKPSDVVSSKSYGWNGAITGALSSESWG